MKLNQIVITLLLRIIKTFSYLVFLILYSSCVHQESEVVRITPPQADENYQPVLTKWSRTSNIYKDLQLQFKINAVLVAPEMEDAYKKRIEYVYGAQAKFEDKILLKNDTIAIILDFFAKPDAHLDLSDENIWHLKLQINDIEVRASQVYPFKRKESLDTFFPASSYWSRYFVVIFKFPYEALQGLSVKDFFSKDKNSSENVLNNQENKIVFSMNTAETQVKFSWGHSY